MSLVPLSLTNDRVLRPSNTPKDEAELQPDECVLEEDATKTRTKTRKKNNKKRKKN